MEALKKYSMLYSSSNYELFIQSKHTKLLKDRRPNDYPLAPVSPLAPSLASINEHRSIDQSPSSYHNSQLSPRKIPLGAELTFRKKTDEVVSPFQESILQGLDSPRKCLEPFKLSREFIPTADTLQSQTLLPATTRPNPLPHLRNSCSIFTVLNEPSLAFQGKREDEFLHLCHLQNDRFVAPEPDGSLLNQEFNKLLLAIQVQSKNLQRPSPLSSFSKGKLDFALPTPIVQSPSHKAKININYLSEATQADSFKKSRRNQAVLTAKEIADKMLFGRDMPTAPAVVERKAVPIPEKDEPKMKKRVSSLPKITFTYTSREKDMRIQSPSAKCIPVFGKEQQSKVLKAGSPRRVKEELQSTFGSSQMATNNSNSRLHTPKQLETHAKVVRVDRDRTGFNPFAARPLASLAPPQRIDSQYYASPTQAQRQPVPQQLRPRMATEALLRGEIEYMGAEEQVRCCWAREGRSLSLNDRALVGGFRPF